MRTKTFTPVLNVPNFHEVFGGVEGNQLLLDEQGLLRAVETILFPDSLVEIQEHLNQNIARIKTKEYPSPGDLFVDARFLQRSTDATDRKAALPLKDDILSFLYSCAASRARYIWGGNCRQGVPELLELYPPKKANDPRLLDLWMLKGCDCSGLLYEATNGLTPRNTSQLLFFGEGLDIENFSLDSILSKLKPLDLIVWKGHVIVVLDPATCIESKGGQGVVQSDLKQRLSELAEQGYTPVNCPQKAHSGSRCYVVRRWVSNLSLLF